MENSILLTSISPAELGDLIDKRLKEGLDPILKKLNTDNPINELLTRSETCELLKIDSSTLWHWTNSGKVKAHGIGSRRYYKKSELLEALTPCK
ncbi:helix-turn-helix domain-containing protein [Ulvibacterium marinum]|uniref:DNA-binding protein n=1 Tax=Ulvibacterium marinum TaxID=2419782 RepID=A0A3B0CEP5_9FLAO|nr:helix-turn-helix domain-containing protein [Ulvibacterium marinum]RKN83348.1 DNA-binding protein [Ulvibacterium marinum]